MPLEFSKAKNQSATCSFNGIFLHSSYNPENEGKKFAENIRADFSPQNIIVIEPALSYCAVFLKKQFPDADLFAVRFLKDFGHSEFFKKEFFFENSEQLKQELFSFFSEENLLNSLFISWPPSARVFCKEDADVWHVIKDAVKDAETVLVTRQFFSKRWMKNQVKFFCGIKKHARLKKIDIPVLVCASGKSLGTSLPFIKKYADFLFIIACSSSIQCLVKNGIVPDLCISTDGGYWAKKHLECLLFEKDDIPVALTPESSVPQKLFSKNTVVPLVYGDNFDSALCSKFGISFTPAKRNGTVSGTAAELALSLTDCPVFFCGLDLETNAGFPHTQPNSIELQNAAKDNRLKTKETRVFMQSSDDVQLAVYRNWFTGNSAHFENRLFRLSDNYAFKHSLGRIPDISWSEFEKYAKLKSEKKNPAQYFLRRETFAPDGVPHSPSRGEIQKAFSALFENEQFIRNYFPADCIAIDRAKDETQKTACIKKLKEKIDGIKRSPVFS